MPRQPHHSKNWGGARPNTGPKKGAHRNLAEKALDIVSKAEQHPLEYMLEVMANKENPAKLRLDAAQSAMPYVMTRLVSTEISVTRTTDGMSDDQLLQRYLATQSELSRLLPQGKLINGSAQRVNGTAEQDVAEVLSAKE